MQLVGRTSTRGGSLVAEDYVGVTPIGRVQIANELIASTALDWRARRMAGQILRHVANVPNEGPRHLARWVRANILYLREAPGVEILQGLFTTSAARVGDCDDLSIMWASLLRSAGIPAFLVGVGWTSEPRVLQHAIGRDGNTGILYELTDDSSYGGPFGNGIFFRRKDGMFLVYYDPSEGHERYYVSVDKGHPFVGAENEEQVIAIVGAHHRARQQVKQAQSAEMGSLIASSAMSLCQKTYLMEVQAAYGLSDARRFLKKSDQDKALSIAKKNYRTCLRQSSARGGEVAKGVAGVFQGIGAGVAGAFGASTAFGDFGDAPMPAETSRQATGIGPLSTNAKIALGVVGVLVVAAVIKRAKS